MTATLDKNAELAASLPLRQIVQAHRYRFYMLAGIFSIVQILIVGICWIALEAVDIGRAYVAGEATYSKAQKTAILQLHYFIESGEHRYYDLFRENIEVPLGDRKAREELEKPNPDFTIARDGFLEAKIVPDDVAGMCNAFVWLRQWKPFAAAIVEWKHADDTVQSIITLANRINALQSNIGAQSPERASWKRQIDQLDQQLTIHETRFSDQIRKASEQLRTGSVMLLLLGSTGLFLAGLFGTWKISSGAVDSERRAWDASRQLLKLKVMAETANKSKSAFLANMSHELRTPLNAIIGFSEVIKDQIYGNLGNEKYLEYATDIHSSGRHLLSLISDILDLSRIESERLEMQETEVNLQETVDCVVSLLRERATRGHVHLKVNLDDPSIVLRSDPLRLKQILINLVSNAVKFTRPDGVVEIFARASSHELVIGVKDTGTGMTAEGMATAMEPFGQVDDGLNRKSEGTGLGLPITKKLTTMLGGRFELASEPGVGTTASCIFPTSIAEKVPVFPVTEHPIARRSHS